MYSTYVGGSQTDSITGVAALDGVVFLSGGLCSPDFPTVTDPNASQCEAYVAELWATDGRVEEIEGTGAAAENADDAHQLQEVAAREACSLVDHLSFLPTFAAAAAACRG